MSAAMSVDAFSPSQRGHQETRWLQMLADAKPWSPLGRLMIVSPHPDDEVLGAGGLIHEWAAAGNPVSIVSVTDGEAAYAKWPALGAVRTHELHCALRRLSATHIPVTRLGLPDGQVEQSRNRLRNALTPLITADLTVVAPFESDGHPDHNTIGEVCLELSRISGAACARYPIWRWHHGNLSELEPANWGRFRLSPEAQRAKARAVRCFASQIAPEGHDPILPSHVLGYFARDFEAFVI